MNLFTKTALLTIFLTSSLLVSKAQNYTVKGIVVDTAGLPLPGAIVRIKWAADSLGIAANSDGTFLLAKVKSRQFTLSAAFIGFQTFIKQYSFETGELFDLSKVSLKTETNTLDGVVISGAPPVKISEDTVSFNASSFPVREGDAVDEILKAARNKS